MIGLLTALELSARGRRVRLLDMPGQRAPASWAGGGILSPLFPWRYDDAVNRLCVRADDAYLALSEQIRAAGGVDPEVTRCGMLVHCTDPREQIEQWAARYEQPLVLREFAGGGHEVWLPRIANVRNSRLLKGLRVLVAARGMVIESACVDSYRELTDKVIVVAGGREIAAQQLILAAGWWTASLLPDSQAGLFFPAKGQMLLYRCRPGQLGHIVLSDDGYLIPRRDGRILVGSTVEPQVSDMQATAAARQRLASLAATLMPELAGMQPEAHWAGVRPGNRRQAPVMDRVQGCSNVWVSTGHFRNGLVTAPASARLLAQRLCEEHADRQVADYSFSSPGSSDNF